MLKGDISNEIPPRCLVIFENCLGFLPDDYKTKEKSARILRQWKRVIRYWKVYPVLRDALFNVSWRSGLRFDVVSFQPEGFIEVLPDWLDIVNVPYSHILPYENESELSKDLSHMPEVLFVFHSDSTHKFTYGNRGFLVDPQKPALPV